MAYHILPGISLQALIGLFEQSPCAMARWEPIAGKDLPLPYRDLLVHRYHMTSMLERYHDQSVYLKVLDESRQEHQYARKILLGLEGTDDYVQFAVMRVEAHRCAAGLWNAILEGQLPMGRILTENNVRRRVRPDHFLKVTPGPELMAHFKLNEPVPLYGRLATIYWDDEPTVRVLEVLPAVADESTMNRHQPKTLHSFDAAMS